MPYVYAIICDPTGDLYIGSTRLSLEDRWSAHRAAWRRGKSAPRLQAAVDEHGPDAMSFVMLREGPEARVRRIEQRLIRDLQPALNTYLYRPAPVRKSKRHPPQFRGPLPRAHLMFGETRAAWNRRMHAALN